MALHSWAARTQASGRTRTHRSPLPTWEPTIASPSRAVRSSSSAFWRSSVAVVGPVGTSADDNRLPSPAVRHALVLDPLLEEDDALQQRLGPGRTPGYVHVDRDDLIDALGDRVGIPVRAAAVGARA